MNCFVQICLTSCVLMCLVCITACENIEDYEFVCSNESIQNRPFITGEMLINYNTTFANIYDFRIVEHQKALIDTIKSSITEINDRYDRCYEALDNMSLVEKNILEMILYEQTEREWDIHSPNPHLKPLVERIHPGYTIDYKYGYFKSHPDFGRSYKLVLSIKKHIGATDEKTRQTLLDRLRKLIA
jgi:hypothetical protein